MKSLYLLVNFFTVLLPFIFTFHPKIKFQQTRKALLVAVSITAFIFIVWDSIFTSLRVWSFNPRYILGIYILNLPLEEVLFFICIPYSCIFTFYCLDKFYDLSWNMKTENAFCIILSASLLVAGILFLDRLYTSSTFISASIFCLILKFILRVNWFGKAVTVYAVLLIPFFIVNGILTGTGPDEPVVIYDPAQNLGMSILTIPLEDIIYGFELFLLNLFIYLRIKDTPDLKPGISNQLN